MVRVMIWAGRWGLVRVMIWAGRWDLVRVMIWAGRWDLVRVVCGSGLGKVGVRIGSKPVQYWGCTVDTERKYSIISLHNRLQCSDFTRANCPNR